MRIIALDVHRSFAQMAVLENGTLRDAGKVDLERSRLLHFAKSLKPDDEVVLEATGNTSAIVRLLSPSVARVVIANPNLVRAIAWAKVKTDKIDARVLAKLHASGFLPEVWMPDEETEARRRITAERTQLVSQMTRLKNRIHSVLHAYLIPPYQGSLFSKRGRTWLEGIVRLAKVQAYGRVSGMSTTSNPYRGFRFPAEIINQAVWLYHCFSLSLREVELILAARGIVVSYETIREWSLRFGRAYAKTLRRRRPKPADKWFLDEVFGRIRGKLHYLWRAVDQHGNVLDVLVQSRRNKTAAKRFFRKLLKGLCYVPRVIVTDKLGSYGAAKREILPSVEHRQSRYLNNRCEVSHQPTRRRERHMRRFKSARHAQQFLATHSPIHNHFQLRRHRLSASEYRVARDCAFNSWRDATGAAIVG